VRLGGFSRCESDELDSAEAVCGAELVRSRFSSGKRKRKKYRKRR
jgi:hypothetical protein